MSSVNIRSLLRNERKARRIEHPHANYSSTGILTCQICRIQLKAESLWDQHINGSHHRGMLQRYEAAQQIPQHQQLSSATTSSKSSLTLHQGPPSTTNGGSKKRKATSDDDIDIDPAEARSKKTKPSSSNALPSDFFAATGAQTQDSDSMDAIPSVATTTNGTATPAGPVATIDETEWAAFTREVASPPPQSRSQLVPPAALMAAATISAAPMTVAELAARSRAEASIQAKEAREAEMEGEKEDAAKRIEDEFEEMEGLEERVRRLRERREALRKARESMGGKGGGIVVAVGMKKSLGNGKDDGGRGSGGEGGDPTDGDDEDEEGDDGDDFEGWGMMS